MTANWNAADDYHWVVPFGGVGRIMRLGSQPVNTGAQFYGNAVHPPRRSILDNAVANCVLILKGDEKK